MTGEPTGITLAYSLPPKSANREKTSKGNTMKKTEITIVIPSIKLLDQSGIIPSFANSPVNKRLFVQFVYLQNLKTPLANVTPKVESFGTHDLITVPNGRFFDTAEENLFRIQDIIGMLKPHVFFVGEHDQIDWEVLEQALASATERQLDVMGWNILCREMKEDGSYSESTALIPVDDVGTANELVKMLLSGQNLQGRLGYLAMLSIYGPLDWSAYIGNHLYRREALAHMLQYSFAEYIYAHVYMQALFFYEHTTSYGFFAKSAIHRVSNDFLNHRKGTRSWVSPRQAQGKTPGFWIGHVSNIAQIQDDALFNVMAHCLRVSLGYNEKGDQVHSRNSMFSNLFMWAREALEFRLSGPSYYFPEQTSGTLQDVRYVRLFFSRLLEAMQRNPQLYRFVNDFSKNALREGVIALTLYLTSLDASEDMIRLANTKFNEAFSGFTDEVVIELHRASFAEYMAAPSRSILSVLS